MQRSVWIAGGSDGPGGRVLMLAIVTSRASWRTVVDDKQPRGASATRGASGPVGAPAYHS